MVDNVEIVNIALSSLGSIRIMALDEDTEPARKVNAIFNIVRNIMLAKHPWWFAVKRVALSQLDETPAFEFSNVHQLPTDCLRVLNTDLLETAEWKVEGRKIYSNASTINIKYIVKVEDPTLFSDGFILAFSDELAARLAYPLTSSNTLATNLRNLAIANLGVAKSQDAQGSGSPDTLDANEWANSRFK